MLFTSSSIEIGQVSHELQKMFFEYAAHNDGKSILEAFSLLNEYAKNSTESELIRFHEILSLIKQTEGYEIEIEIELESIPDSGAGAEQKPLLKNLYIIIEKLNNLIEEVEQKLQKNTPNNDAINPHRPALISSNTRAIEEDGPTDGKEKLSEKPGPKNK